MGQCTGTNTSGSTSRTTLTASSPPIVIFIKPSSPVGVLASPRFTNATLIFHLHACKLLQIHRITRHPHSIRLPSRLILPENLGTCDDESCNFTAGTCTHGVPVIFQSTPDILTSNIFHGCKAFTPGRGARFRAPSRVVKTSRQLRKAQTEGSRLSG